ncbi:MAG: hypothetical protein E6Q70_17120 [Pseudomonas monteilii]|nr:MAG: hypothetical protein E6Q70_17120 [Pseudomonas monteilii]
MTGILSLLQRLERCQLPLHQLFSMPTRYRISLTATTAELTFIHVGAQRIDLNSDRVAIGRRIDLAH